MKDLPVITRDAMTRFRIRAEGGARGAFQAELARLGLTARTEVSLWQGEPPSNMTSLFPQGGVMLARKRKMFVEDIPFQLAASWIPMPLALEADLAQRDTGIGGTYSRLAGIGHEITEFEETVTVREVTGFEDEFLNLGHGVPVYSIRRTARSELGGVVEVTDTVVGAGRLRLLYRWSA